MSVNKVILLGRLGTDPELKYTPSGAAVCNFSLATSESWNDKGGNKQEKTEWHRIVVWSKLAELCNQYLKKGRQAFIEGRIQTRQWEDKTGNKRYTTEIMATSIQFIGDRGERSPERSNGPDNFSQENSSQGMMDKDYQVSSDTNFTADDIPF